MIADALVVVDVQTGLVSGPGGVPAAATLLPAVDDLLARARAAGALVVHLQNDGAAGSDDEPGTPGWELHLPPRAGEPVIRKTADDGFLDTGLGRLLEERGARTLAIVGVMSEMCVSATARTALRRGFGVVLPHDAHATQNIPATPGISDAVPAAVVSRVAEWALGDRATVVPSVADVTFQTGGGPG